MAITATEAAALAERLPKDLAIMDSRTRLLCVVEIMLGLTDKQHHLSNADIRAILEAKFGPEGSTAENTISGDLKALGASGCLGLQLHTSPTGSWVERTEFTPADIRLLVNAVQSCRFLTTAQATRLQDGLCRLASCYQVDDLLDDVHVDQRVPKSYQHVFDACNVISEALRLHRKIEFEYTYTGFDGNAVALPGENGDTLRVETPISLIYGDGNYFMESYADPIWRHSHLTQSRVDRMINVRVSDQPADRSKEIRQLRASSARRLRESFAMVPGEPRILFLRVRSDMTNVMFDTFGFGLKFEHFDGPIGDVATTAVTCVRVADTFTFYRWLCSAGNRIVLEYPKSETWVRCAAWKGIVGTAKLADLRRDYEETKAAYVAFLQRAIEPYTE